jgi:hypothetical protein
MECRGFGGFVCAFCFVVGVVVYARFGGLARGGFPRFCCGCGRAGRQVMRTSDLRKLHNKALKRMAHERGLGRGT